MQTAIICIVLSFFVGISKAATYYESRDVVISNDYLLANVDDRSLSTKRKDENGCSCQNNVCSCCANIDIPHILNKDVCVNITYISADIGLRLDFIIDGKVVFSQEVSVKNPPPICFQAPFLKKLASICLDLYNLSWRDHVGGCLRIEIKLLFIIQKSFNIGCFHFNNLNEESKAELSALLRNLHFLNLAKKRAVANANDILYL